MPATTYPASLTARREQRETRLQRLGFKSYNDYLGSPQWAAVRQRYRDSALVQACVLCGANRVVLHHRTYERVCEERLSDLVPLCPPCHTDVHALAARGDIELGDVEQLRSSERAAQHKLDAARRLGRMDEVDKSIEKDRRNEERRRRNLTIPARLTEAIAEAEAHGVNVSSGLRVIERQIGAIERKTDRLGKLP